MKIRLLCFVLLMVVNVSLARGEGKLELLSVEKIWDQAPHSAFTDLVHYQGKWFCAFREGQGHVSPDGALRILVSVDGTKWESAALITSPSSDLRDAKLSITPGGQLMLLGAEAIPDGNSKQHRSLVWLSSDGTNWTEKQEVGDLNFWLWRVVWHDDAAYGWGYSTKGSHFLRFYRSDDGRNFETLIDRTQAVGYPNETDIIFEEGKAYCLLRRDAVVGASDLALWGTASAPYTNWEWKELDRKIGGPSLIRLADGRFLAGVRLYDQKARTSLCWVDPEAGTLTETLTLPSGGDTSYSGLVLQDDILWVSYYSSHEGKSKIYLAKVRISPSND